MAIIVMDIETAPLPMERLKSVVDPFDPDSLKIDPACLVAFDPRSVKTGNLKDADKIKAKIEEGREKHAAAKAAAEEKMARGETEYWVNVEKRAALSAETAHVAAIGYSAKDMAPPVRIVRVERNDEGSERDALANWWKLFVRCVERHQKIVGHNLCGFDIPFLIRRSWLLGVSVPVGVIDKDRYWNPIFVDTLSRWKLGVYGDSVGLGKLARAMCIGGKPADCDGAGFHKKWYSESEEDRAVARSYLANDLAMTTSLAFRLGVC